MKENKIPVSQEIKKHLLTGISWMIPLVVAAGICIALGQVLGGTDVGEKTGTCLLYTSPRHAVNVKLSFVEMSQVRPHSGGLHQNLRPLGRHKLPVAGRQIVPVSYTHLSAFLNASFKKSPLNC